MTTHFKAYMAADAATLEDFTEEKLLNRRPGLMREFKTAMEKIGFIY